jgi:MoaA/NifB/PqqE/SkfB family radical SAM enzyme
MYKIKAVQIDVNGFCNAGCWFCPVRYEGNPVSEKRDMPLKELDNILKQLKDGKDDFVDKSLYLIYTANYNEVLLYKYFEEMFDVYRKYDFKINILTNGVPLTKSKADIIKKNQDIIGGILLNIPSSNKKTWSEYVNINEKVFDRVIENVKYAMSIMPELIEEKRFYLMVNGVNENSLTDNGGWLDLLENAPKINLDPQNGNLSKEIEGFKELFPGLNIIESYHLYDRAGHLANSKILDQSRAISKYLKPKGEKVVGCNGGIGVRSRTNEWIHITPNGHLFICCADYNFETIYGNINETSLKEIWESSERNNMIKKSYSDMCTRCSAAIWG